MIAHSITLEDKIRQTCLNYIKYMYIWGYGKAFEGLIGDFDLTMLN